jgi:hypothetical protein
MPHLISNKQYLIKITLKKLKKNVTKPQKGIFLAISPYTLNSLEMISLKFCIYPINFTLIGLI